MQKKGKYVSAVLKRIWILGFGVQILLGAVWACGNFFSFQEFGESHFLLKVQETLLCDDYTGILYPIVMRASLGIARLLPLPYYSILYGLQLTMACISACFFLRAFPKFRRAPFWIRVWAVAALVTVPAAMQCHVAVLPNSLATSLFFMQLGIFARGFCDANGPVETDPASKWRFPAGNLSLQGILWLLETLLMPEYRIFGGILLTVYGMGQVLGMGRQAGEQERKPEIGRILKVVLVTAAILGAVSQISKMTMREGAYGRMGNTREAADLRRFAWDNFGELYGYWPQDLKDALTQEEIAICNRYPQQKEWILGERVDGVYGRERAREIYGELAKAAKKVRAGRNFREILKDVASYGMAPAAQLVFMGGKGHVTYSVKNYDVMRAKMPQWTSLYVRYGGWWFLGALVLSLVVQILHLASVNGRERGKRLGALLLFAALDGLIVLHYTFQGGGVMDYKNVLAVTVLWAAWTCYLTVEDLDFDVAGNKTV